MRKFKKYSMWYKVQELKKEGLNISQIRQETGLDRTTIGKYQHMSEEEFHSWIRDERHLPKKLKGYTNFVKTLLSQKPYLSSAQIEDRLKEHFADIVDVHSKTVYNFVQAIRLKYEIPKPGKTKNRQFEKLPEVAYGSEAQVDFGETWLQTKEKKRKKVYFFSMLLSRSRYKFIYFVDKAFTTTISIYAHELVFAYFEGVPHKIIYDQDSVFIHDENLGDYKLTKAFSAFCKTQDFKEIFCRKADPQSKGKIENVVKYVKQNFLRGRDFINIKILNQEALEWLERTGNKKRHSTTQLIPAAEWQKEKLYLLPLKQNPENIPAELKSYNVHKDNVICYKSNYYTLPLGTYQNHESSVLVKVSDIKITIYDTEKRIICSHDLSLEKGKIIRNTDHKREKSKTTEIFQQQVLGLMGKDEFASDYLKLLKKDKSRYYRDNLQYFIKNHEDFSSAIIKESLLFCIENKIYNTKSLIEIIKQKQLQESQNDTDVPEIKKLKITEKHQENKQFSDVEKSKITTYENCF